MSKPIEEILFVEDDEYWYNKLQQELQDSFPGAYVEGHRHLEGINDAMELGEWDLYVTDGTYPLNAGGNPKSGAWKQLVTFVREKDSDARIVVVSASNLAKEAAALNVHYVAKGNLYDDFPALVEKLQEDQP